MLYWLTQTDRGLLLRILLSISVLAILAVADLKRKGQSATRWREYVVLVACVAAAICYGVINDQITSSISWEYFYYVKNLSTILGNRIPPDATALHLQAVKVAAEATWWVGLILGVVLLYANNPRPNLPRLSNRSIVSQLPLIAVFTGILAAAIGICGYLDWLPAGRQNFADVIPSDSERARRFLCTWGVHLGGYAGGAIGTLIAAVRILHL